MEKSTPNPATMPSSHLDPPSHLGREGMRLRPAIANAHFAGRIGGNQEFIADPDSDDTQSLLKRQPDAVSSKTHSSLPATIAEKGTIQAPLTSAAASLGLKSFLEPELWRMAVLEGWGVSPLDRASAAQMLTRRVSI